MRQELVDVMLEGERLLAVAEVGYRARLRAACPELAAAVYARRLRASEPDSPELAAYDAAVARLSEPVPEFSLDEVW